jgi:hypothetical protein
MKRRYRFGLDYFGNWTLTELIRAGYTLTIKGQKND